ncbi:class II glutamine amidotransferase [Lutibaculum baratangense]|uniref:Glutamine amidotransferase protein GlxB n=1 Tax=Lutibaculum baratangense AMV1 TaxID=631454 RepID=V4TI24_9HYPH|nr:glutamine amidotransferase family protein [Lutibaculum baratangense]ESR25663.1 Glutamine amidotransferase protein GlxB [Lutibaculum baratangense AMV1]
MCGIVGLFLKRPELEPELGTHLSRMLATMSARGPDSAGFAVYGSGTAGKVKLTVSAAAAADLEAGLADLGAHLEEPLAPQYHETHAVVSVPEGKLAEARRMVEGDERLSLVGVGTRMELYKEVGLPEKVAERFGLSDMHGTHGVGHTRMATESAVTTRGAHPFSTSLDECLVHNGSLSNHNALRRMLSREGIRFSTENDTEVAAGYLTWRLQQGASLKEALEASLKDLDGFYTFVVGTENGFAVLRDPISCKPAVMAETDDYVAFGSEYRALAGLPGVDKARVFEPKPATVYAWERQ